MTTNLLNKDIDRKLRLLTILSQNRWIQIDSLVSEIKVSKQTVLKDIANLNDIYDSTINIKFDKKKGVKLEELKNQNIQAIYIDAYKNSRKTSLLIDLLLNPPQSSFEWEKRLFISHSTLYRDLKDIKSFLADRQIVVNMDPVEIISNDERQLRFFFTHYLLNTTYEWPFDLDESHISQLSLHLNKQFKLNLSKFELTELDYLIALTLTRQIQGYFIDNVDIKYVEFFHLDYHASEKVDVLILDTVSKLNISKDVFNLTNFYYTVFWWYFGWENELEYQKLNNQTDEFINSLKVRFDCEMIETINIKIKKYLLSIYLKHKIYPKDHLKFYDRRTMFANSLEITFKAYHEEILELLLMMEKQSNFPWYSMYKDQIVSFIFINWKNLFLNLESKKPTIDVLVVSDLGEGHTQMVCYFLEKYFGREIHMTTANPDEMRLVLSTNDCDLVVTNIKDMDNINIDFYIIDDVPTLRNLENLREIFTHLTYEKVNKLSSLVG
ncbi:helix-turn-helix domain-containing protein [Enterococcus sp. ALS3]|uniref:Helix-turn-helix domain-containing protein n=1 Tax=Enterococcus alishanensis TaxID=1303817 RepID=A0ABS6TH34_9ENTE|nr:helix-turn-helix domain-containing protein [Enterococcus alishanensis]